MKSNWKVLVLIALLSSAVTLGAYNLLGFNKRDVVFTESSAGSPLTRLASLTGNAPTGAPGDFAYAAETASPTVVHIRTTMTRTVRQQQVPDIFREFFGDEFGGQGGSRPRREQGQASGSGVIISKDGYIVTNNHVVQDADEVEVIMTDKRSFKAKVIGTDPLTDLAVVKIEANNLPTIVLGDSDGLKLGEWVLAVGYPLDLESTVTAGIVSAKGRRIGILDRAGEPRRGGGLAPQQPDAERPAVDTPVESFIQTDAAINPGNSGGALVNLRGELIGINSAIASATGYYSGYGFAVPVSLVKKVTADLVKFGNVQRGYIGILPIELDSKKAADLKTKVGRGIYIDKVTENGAAKTAGLQKGDVIVKMEGQPLDSDAQMREIIGRRRPGDVVNVTINRDGTERDVKVELRNRNGGRDVIKKEEVATAGMKALGAEFSNLSDKERQALGASGGVRVNKIMDGKLAQTEIEEGFIIVKANGKNVKTVKDLETIVGSVKEGEGLLLIGMYPNSSRMIYYAVPY